MDAHIVAKLIFAVYSSYNSASGMTLELGFLLNLLFGLSSFSAGPAAHFRV